MRIMMLMIGVMFLALTFSGNFAGENQLLAQYPPAPAGCCKQRAWLAAEWSETELSFPQCEELNRNRDNLDDLRNESGYVWWDVNCKP